MALNYGWEKLFSACDYAIASAESPQKRLEGVVGGILHLKREDVPSNQVWNRLEALIRTATRKDAKGSEGRIAATTSQMNADEASQLLSQALSLFNDVAMEYGRKGNSF